MNFRLLFSANLDICLILNCHKLGEFMREVVISVGGNEKTHYK